MLIYFIDFIHVDVKHLQRYALLNVSFRFVTVTIGSRRLEIVNGHYQERVRQYPS